MPTISTALQKQFKLNVQDGVLQGAVDTHEDGQWLMCCPLCGCVHQIQSVDESVPYTPLCQTIPLLFKAQQVIWRKLYPDTANYTTLRLVRRTT